MAALTINIPNKTVEQKEDVRKCANMSSAVLQNTSEQDVALCGTTKDFDFLIVSDGHGSGQKKHVLREFIKNLDCEFGFQA